MNTIVLSTGTIISLDDVVALRPFTKVVDEWENGEVTGTKTVSLATVYLQGGHQLTLQEPDIEPISAKLAGRPETLEHEPPTNPRIEFVGKPAGSVGGQAIQLAGYLSEGEPICRSCVKPDDPKHEAIFAFPMYPTGHVCSRCKQTF